MPAIKGRKFGSTLFDLGKPPCPLCNRDLDRKGKWCTACQKQKKRDATAKKRGRSELKWDVWKKGVE